MATIQIPVDEITASARQVRMSMVLLTLFLGVFWVAGWIAGKAVLGLVIAAYSVRRGYMDGFGASPRPPASKQ